ncbi:MAG: CAAX prenyl protease-related protein [Gemmatimonadota bacterium]|nr:CAAX prenyl protease-related protein [Gemmatimonadota bacterium]
MRVKTAAWVAPFAVLILWLAIERALPIANPAKELLRDVVIAATIILCSRDVLPRRAPHWRLSGIIGLMVFALWIAPDELVSGWRDHWLFQNAITGRLRLSIPPGELTPWMLTLRTMRAALLVPIAEELFWRGWLPRWLQDTRFERIPLGQYTPLAFWATAALFAMEHGPFWEVGLACGVIYNGWMRRTRSLGDLIVAHAATNLALSLYVIVSGRWSFWM